MTNPGGRAAGIGGAKAAAEESGFVIGVADRAAIAEHAARPSACTSR